MNLNEIMNELYSREDIANIMANKYCDAKRNVEEIKQIIEKASTFNMNVIKFITELISIKENKLYTSFGIVRVIREPYRRKKLIDRQYKYKEYSCAFVTLEEEFKQLDNQEKLKSYFEKAAFFSDITYLGHLYSYESVSSEKTDDYYDIYDFDMFDKTKNVIFYNVLDKKYDISHFNSHDDYMQVTNHFNWCEYVKNFIEYLFDLQVQNDGKQLTYEEMKKALNDFLELEKQKEVKASKVKVRKIKKPNNKES